MKRETVETFYAIVERNEKSEKSDARGNSKNSEESARFRVRYPDFPTLGARANTIDQSTRVAAGVLRDEIRRRIESTRGVPRPTSLQTIKDDPTNRSSFVLKVPVRVPARGSPPGAQTAPGAPRAERAGRAGRAEREGARPMPRDLRP